MKILLVEDEEDKRLQIINFITQNLSNTYTEVKSFQSARKAIDEDYFDLIILDMSIPTFDVTPSDYGGRSQPFGGEAILYELLRNGINTKVIVVTQFDIFGKGEEEVSLKDLDLRLKKLFENNYLGAVQFSIKYTAWTGALLNKITNASLLNK